MVSVEGARTDALDRKAASLATFASLVLSLTAALGSRLVSGNVAAWVFALFALGLFLLVLAIGLSVWVLLPKEQLMLGVAYLERFTKWSEILKPRVQVQAETMAGLIEAIALERQVNRGKARAVRWAPQPPEPPAETAESPFIPPPLDLEKRGYSRDYPVEGDDRD